MTNEQRAREAAGIKLPDKPGVWFRDWNDIDDHASDFSQAWVVYSLPGNPALRAAWITPGGELRCHNYVSALTGNWQPAVPASALAERDAAYRELWCAVWCCPPEEFEDGKHAEAVKEAVRQAMALAERDAEIERLRAAVAGECFWITNREYEAIEKAMGFHNASPSYVFEQAPKRLAEIERLKARIAHLERPGAVRIGEQA